MVVGSYERGDRAVTVARLAELADFYGVPVAELLPGADARPTPSTPPGRPDRVVIDLVRLARVPAERAGPLSRFVAAIQRRRGDYNGRVLTLRSEDLVTLSMVYGVEVDEVVEMLVAWGVLGPRPVGDQPGSTESER